MQKIEISFYMQEKCFDIKIPININFPLIVLNHKIGGKMSLEKMKKGNIEFTNKFKESKKIMMILLQKGNILKCCGSVVPIPG